MSQKADGMKQEKKHLEAELETIKESCEKIKVLTEYRRCLKNE